MNGNSKFDGTRFEEDSLNAFEFDGRVARRDVAGKTEGKIVRGDSNSLREFQTGGSE
jgi:hypothetical protein